MDTPTEYVCIDPEVGELRHRERSSLSDQERGALEAHLAICRSCEVVVAMDSVLRDAGAAYRQQWRARLRSMATGLRTAAAGCLVAGLIGIFLLTPSRGPLFGGSSARLTLGDEGVVVERPFEGEVLAPSGGDLRWTGVEGAQRYDVTVRGMGSDYLWTREGVEGTQITLPTDVPAGGCVAEVMALPDHLAGGLPGEVYFQRGSWAQFASYRLQHLPRVVLALLVAGVILLGIGLSIRPR